MCLERANFFLEADSFFEGPKSPKTFGLLESYPPVSAISCAVGYYLGKTSSRSFLWLKPLDFYGDCFQLRIVVLAG